MSIEKERDAAGKLVRVWKYDTAGNRVWTWEWKYDSAGNLLRAWEREYDCKIVRDTSTKPARKGA
jgi:hypothetical protein